MRITTFGWRNRDLDQLSRIEKGFIELGHEIVTENPDFIYSHDFSDWHNAWNCKQLYPNAKYMQKVLDIPTHIINTDLYDLEGNKEKLKRADLVLSNSNTVKSQIKHFFDLESHVVYDAVKDVKRLDTNKEVDYIIVGRNSDKNKRGKLFEEFVALSEIKGKFWVVVGSEPLPRTYMNYVGILSDDNLNNLYNSTKIGFCLGKIEGICLPLIENLIVGNPVICLSDNPTAYEFCPHEMICDPTIDSIIVKVKEIEHHYDKFKKIAQEYGDKYKDQFNKVQIAKNIINVYENEFKKL